MVYAKTVAIIDHDDATRELFIDILEDLGYTVLYSESIGDIGSLATLQPDAIILDIAPIAIDTGLAFINKLYMHSQLTHTPLLLSSTTSQTLEQVQGDMPPLLYTTMLKPFQVDDLQNSLERLFRASRQIRSIEVG